MEHTAWVFLALSVNRHQHPKLAPIFTLRAQTTTHKYSYKS
jgi:hypothetical protein